MRPAGLIYAVRGRKIVLGFDWPLLGNRIDVRVVMNNSNKVNREVAFSSWQGRDKGWAPVLLQITLSVSQIIFTIR